MKNNRTLDILKNNYFIIIFVIIILFVGIASIYKLTKNNTTTIYTKVKLGQGLWWAGGNKPSIWIANSIKKGDYQKDFMGKKIVEVQSVTYYPWYNIDQFDVYLTLKLQVGGNPKTQTYSFNRATIGVGSPVDIALNNIQVSGTIIDISLKPFDEKYIDKIIYLYKKNALPWEYDAINIGDKYNDGKYDIFEILDKADLNTSTIGFDSFGNSDLSITEMRKYITVKAKIKVKVKNDQLILGEDQVIRAGKPVNISTESFTFTDYFVGKIE